jgi:hypothetical protein
VSNFAITPEQPVARRAWTIKFEYTPSGPVGICERLATFINHTSAEQLKACTPAKSYSRVAEGGKKCLMTVHCGRGGDTVGGLQSLEAVIQLKPHGNRPVQTLEKFAIANAPYTNTLVGCGCTLHVDTHEVTTWKSCTCLSRRCQLASCSCERTHTCGGTCIHNPS